MEEPIQSPTKKIDMLSRTVVALALGVVIGSMISLVGLSTLAEHIPYLVMCLFVIILLAAFIVFGVVQHKEKILKKVFGVDDTDIGIVKSATQSMLKSAVDRDWPNTEAHFNVVFSKLLAWYSWNSFKRWVIVVFQTLFLGFGGMLGTFLLYNQNKLLTQQNGLLQQQNYRLDQQTYLQEADRRSSLIFLMGNLLDAIDEELKTDIGQPGIRDLSPQIVGRIIALSNSLKPYRYMDADSLIPIELSPERGQLLISIINSQIDNRTLRKVFQFADFSCADLSGAVLGGEYLSGINLREADLSKADLNGVDMNGADLNKADLDGVILANTLLQKANLSEVDLREAILKDTDMRGASLYGADLRGIDLADMDLRGAYLDQIKLDSAIVPRGDWFTYLSQLPRDSSIRGDFLYKKYHISKVGVGSEDTIYILLPNDIETDKN